MFQINDNVSYTNKGIFQVKNIIEKRKGRKEKEFWYVLHNIKGDVETSITTPSTNPNLRLIMKKDDILALIDKMPSLTSCWDDDKRIREERFQSMLDSGDIWMWAQLANTIYLMKKQKEEIKKTISDKDKYFFDRAEDLLFDEISLCFHIKREKVHDFIFSKLHAQPID